MTVDELIAHTGSLDYVPADIRERVRDCLPHYLWVTTDNERRCRYVHCEQCDTDAREERRGGRYTHAYKQGKETVCPYCGGRVVVKYVNRGFQNVRDRINVVWYDRSRTAPGAVVAFGAHCRRELAYAVGRPWLEAPDIEIRSVCVVIPGKGGFRFRKNPLEWEHVGGGRYVARRARWTPVKRLGHLTFGTNYCAFGYVEPLRVEELTDTLETALRMTPLARAWDDSYGVSETGKDCVPALCLLAKYPCCEYLTKLGMTEIIAARADNRLPPHLINWRGRSVAGVLKMSAQRWGELKHARITPTLALLALYRWMDGHGYRLTAPAAWNVAVLAERNGAAMDIPATLERTLEDHDPTRRQKALKYIARQADRCGDTRLRLGDFRDYWAICRRLGENLTEDATAFPSDVRAAEARLQAREDRERRLEEARKNKVLWAAQDEKIAKNLPRLQRRFGFSFGGLTLRPAASGDEVRGEGEALHHCVGGYVDSYANGNTVICVLRRDVEPDRPWRTVEISPKTGKLIQDRGYRNDTTLGTPLTEQYRAALDLFWEAWGERNEAPERIPMPVRIAVNA